MLGRGSEYVSPPQIPPEAAVITDTNLEYGFFILQNVLAKESQSPPACLELFLHMLCLVAKPPCNGTTNLPLLLCPQTCNVYEKLIFSGLCDDLVARIIRTLEATEYTWYNGYLTAFNCSDPAPYFQNAPLEVCENSSSCTNLFNPETEGIILHCTCCYANVKIFSYSAVQYLRDESFYRYVLHILHVLHKDFHACKIKTYLMISFIVSLYSSCKITARVM